MILGHRIPKEPLPGLKVKAPVILGYLTESLVMDANCIGFRVEGLGFKGLGFGLLCIDGDSLH